MDPTTLITLSLDGSPVLSIGHDQPIDAITLCDALWTPDMMDVDMWALELIARTMRADAAAA